ncbi:MAG TPA: hypothetical protein PKM73_05750 [Verrucomicrobiota bacterium]|nr:hypothetical protein [Verrucomicrobiota bacterium]
MDRDHPQKLAEILVWFLFGIAEQPLDLVAATRGDFYVGPVQARLAPAQGLLPLVVVAHGSCLDS